MRVAPANAQIQACSAPISARPNKLTGSPLAKKLGIKEEARIAFVGAPEGFRSLLEPLPAGVEVRQRARGPLDVVVFFSRRAGELERRFERLAAALKPAGALWIAWPKRSSGVETDVDGNVAREIGLAAGLVDNKVCAIDETWSGLRFVVRLRDR
jgi:hypothetical protein